MKIYNKTGNKNYKENRMIKKLEEVFAKKLEQNPNFEFKTASNIDELKKMYEQYCSDEVAFETTSAEKTVSTDKETTETIKTDEPLEGQKDAPKFEPSDNSDVFIDPLNREEPNVREYVDKDEFAKPSDAQKPVRTDFAEPTSFEESFVMPGDETPKAKPNTNQNNNQNNQNQSHPNNQQQKPQPVNPEFDTMSSGKKKRSTKKFAKYIVEAVCMLSEKGFVWYANKDINEGKLVEYELAGDMELNLLVSIDGEQEMTVKQFFLEKCRQAEVLMKIDAEEKNDLIDALAELLLEKGVGPTPSQELALIALTIFGRQVMTMFDLRSQTNNVLNQLRKNKETGFSEFEEERPMETEEKRSEPAQQQEKKTSQQPEVFETITGLETEQPVKQEEKEDELPIVDKPVPTLE